MTVIRFFHEPTRRSAHETSDAEGLAGEHGALTRQMAALQRRVSEQLADCMRQIRRLEGDVVRLRGRLIRSRTALSWGLAGASLPAEIAAQARARPPSRLRHVALATQAAAAATMPEASAVICQSGCAGHAHPWLEADGLCRRTGATCGVGVSVDEDASTGPAQHSDQRRSRLL